jgi:ribosomal protein L3 glutamine methyltransferase
MTLVELVVAASERLKQAGVSFGHGTGNAFDEAAWLVTWSLGLPLDSLESKGQRVVSPDEQAKVDALLARRIESRKPAAYLTGEAWLLDIPFTVDERAIVPRSYIAELLFERLSPWIAEPDAVADILDLCTGSGCLAIIAADAFPGAAVDAVDLSAEALAVARINVDDYALAERVALTQSDLWDALPPRRYDLIVSNPPYVNDESMARLPDEYRREPSIALAGGRDGLDVVRRILAGAADRLAEDGLLVVEVGHERVHVEAAFPDLPLTWLSTSGGDDAVFAVRAGDLR